MTECMYNYFILNDEVKKTENFDYDALNKGKTIYEVINVKKGVPLFLEKHLERVYNTAELLNVKIWIDKNEIKNNVIRAINENNAEYGSLKFIFNFETINFVVFFEKIKFPSTEHFNEGIKTELYNIERKNPNAKILNVNFRDELDNFINKKNIFEALLVDNEGNITEGSKSNVFLIADGQFITTPSKAVLLGITRSVIFEICNKLDIKIIEKMVNVKDVDKLEGAFISSTPFGILPIKNIGYKKLLSSNNILVAKIVKEYNRIVEEYIKSFKAINAY